MARHYTTTLSLSIGGDVPTWEGEATVCFSVCWGRAETPPSYSHGGLPADPDEVEDITVIAIDDQPIAARLHGRFEAETLETHIECNDRLVSDLLTYAREIEADDYAEAMDRIYEDRRERAREA